MSIVERVLKRADTTYQRIAADEDEPVELEAVEELDIAEYLIFLLALDTYMRYVHETVGPRATDELIQKGVTLVRRVDSTQSEAMQGFLSGALSGASQQRMLNKAFSFLPNRKGLGQRSMRLRTVLSRGGASTMRQVFKSNRALRGMKVALAAHIEEDADAALDKFAGLTMKNALLRGWIKKAADTAGSGTYINAVSEAADQAVEDDVGLTRASAQEIGNPPSSDASAAAKSQRDDMLLEVETAAADTAKRIIERSGDVDSPPTRSEVVGIAVAAAKAVATDTMDVKNIPDALKSELGKHGPPDPEQVAAAMTDGRVLVAAGAGAGKSTTLVARIKHLVEDRGVPPSRILAVSFNKKAADELKAKIAKAIGPAAAKAATVGTMNGIFRRFIAGGTDGFKGFGSPEEKAMMTGTQFISPPMEGQRGPRGPSPTTMSVTIRNIFKDCSPESLAEHTGWPVEIFEELPKAKQMNLHMTKWQGNDVSLEEAKEQATGKTQKRAVVWFEFYQGLKGDIPGWRPPCGKSKAYDNFMGKYRRGGERLGDFNDQLKIMRDIMVRDSRAKNALQGKFDHFNVDECQDLNSIQHEIFEMATEQIQEGDGKSLWMVGDDSQSIYQFRGARPEMFVGLDGKEGWTTKMIRTNYRCAPEIVETAGRLIAYNDDRIDMEAQPHAAKERGAASIKVDVPPTNADAAIDTIGRVRKDLDDPNMDAQPEDYAVLARTNKELNDFETACIINEIPYIRKGGKGFLDAPESKAVLGYIDLAGGTDYEKKVESLISVLTNPDRGLFLGAEKIERAVKDAIDDVARSEGMDAKSVDPTEMVNNYQYAEILAENLKRPYKLKITRGKGGPRFYDKLVGELANTLTDIGRDVRGVQAKLKDETASTEDLINHILDETKSTVRMWNRETRREEITTTSLREHISDKVALFGGEEDSDDADEAAEAEDVKPEFDAEGNVLAPVDDDQPKDLAAGLGSVKFLFALAEPNANDQAAGTDPTIAGGFMAKIQRFEEMAKTLRVDPREWGKKMKAEGKDPDTSPPAITLSTVHSVKGAEWENVTVVMPKGKFPMERSPKPGEEDDFEPVDIKAERNLAYVALTRAAKNLEIVCPQDSIKVRPGQPPPTEPVVSPFVLEAGLLYGENVPKPDTGTGPTPMVDEDVKLASMDVYSDYDLEGEYLRFMSQEDRWRA